MAARARRGAAAGAARPPAAGEGGGWLCRVYGRSPAEGDLAVYALLPRLPAPGSLGRLAAVLSADPGFEAKKAWAERLPFAVAGYAVVNPKSGDVTPAVPEETLRALEEYRSRRGVRVLLTYSRSSSSFPLIDLLWLREGLRGLGLGFKLRTLRYSGEGGSYAIWGLVELLAPRPLAAEERARARRLIRERLDTEVAAVLPSAGEERALEEAGLLPLAEIVPSLRWRGGYPLWGEVVPEKRPALSVLIYELPHIYDDSPLGESFRAEGPRGVVQLIPAEGIYADTSVVDERFLEAAVKARDAAERLAWKYREWLRLVAELKEAEGEVASPLSIGIANHARAVDPWLRAKVWEEGGRVKVWLHPELKRWLEEKLVTAGAPAVEPFEGLRGYLRRVSERLGREVELVGEEPPFRWSPEVDAALEELRRALAELVGSA